MNVDGGGRRVTELSARLLVELGSEQAGKTLVTGGELLNVPLDRLGDHAMGDFLLLARHVPHF